MVFSDLPVDSVTNVALSKKIQNSTLRNKTLFLSAIKSRIVFEYSSA